MGLRARSTTLSVKQPPSFKKAQQQKSALPKSLIIKLKIPKLVDGNEMVTEASCVDLEKKSLVIKLKVPKRVADDVTPAKNDVTPPKPTPESLLQKSAPAPALTGNKNRDYIRQNFARSLGKAAEELGRGSNKVGDLAVSMETHLYEAWGLCNGPKKQKYLSVLFNLRDDKNPDFRKKVLQGLVAPEEIPSLTPKEMASEARKLEDQKILAAKKEQEIKVLDDDYVMQKD